MQIYYLLYQRTKKNKFRKPNNNLNKYNSIKNELAAIYDHIAEGIQIRNKLVTCMSTAKNQQHYYLKFRKTTRPTKYTKKLIIDDMEDTDQTYFGSYKKIYETLFKKREQKSMPEIKDFINAN